MLPFLTQSSMMSLNTHIGNTSPVRPEEGSSVMRAPNRYGVDSNSIRQEVQEM